MSMKCTDAASIYQDMPACRGSVALPGLYARVYGISKRDIVKYPTMPSAPTTLEEAGTYEGSFTLAADKKWHVVGTIPDQNNVQVESQGEIYNKTFKNTLTFLIPGTGPKATGYINQLNNDEMVYLAVMRDKSCRVIGSEAFSALVNPSQATGSAVTDTNATTVTVEANDEYAAPYYTGTIETADGNFSGADGSAVDEG